MLAGVIAGGLLGCFLPVFSMSLKPVGDIFLNLLFVLVVPLVFFSVTLSFFRMKSGGRLGRVLGRTALAFAVLWLAGSLVSYFSGLLFNPLGADFDVSAFAASAARKSADASGAIVSAVSVSDFPQLFSKFSLLPLIVFSALLGAGIASAGEKGRALAELFVSGNEVTIKTMDILMKVAPLGLGCFFAATVAEVGGQLLTGYLRVFVLYCILSALAFFVINPAFVWLKRGRAGVKAFWREILPPSLIALASSSSSAAMPGNIEAAKRMGLEESVVDTVVPLSTNLLKLGSVMVAVLKVMFLLLLTGQDVATLGSAILCCSLAVLAGVVTGAVTNGGVTGEVLVCSIMGVDPSLAGVIMVIGTICDVPSTLVNSQSNVVAAVLSDTSIRK